MQTTVEADSDNLVAGIPPEILDRTELQVGEDIELSLENGVIIIKRSD